MRKTRTKQIQPSEPRLFANLRRYFADFPYLHCSIDQRLLTLETCCGYGYGQLWNLCLHQIICSLWFSWFHRVAL